MEQPQRQVEDGSDLACLADHTARSYMTGMKLFLEWRGPVKSQVTAEEVRAFLKDAKEAGLSYEMANKVRCALAITEKLYNGGKQLIMQQPWVSLILKGWEKTEKRKKAEAGPESVRTWPLTWSRLCRALEKGWRTSAAAMVTMAHIFMLRWSEVEGLKTGVAKVAWMRNGCARLQLSFSKADQMAEGCTVVFKQTEFKDGMRSEAEWAMELLKGRKEWAAHEDANRELRAVFCADARFHSARHGRCSDLASEGIPEARIQELGRWSSKKAMRLYVHLVGTQVRDV